MELIKDISILFAVILSISALLGGAVAWGRLVEKQNAQDSKIKSNKDKIQTNEESVKKSLYDKDSLPIFLPRKECPVNQEKCSRGIYARLGGFGKELALFKVGVRQDLKEIKTEIKSNEDKRMTELILIRGHMARIETKIEAIEKNTNGDTKKKG